MGALLNILIAGLWSVSPIFANETLRVQTANPNVEVFDRPSFSGRVVEKLPKQTVLEVTARKVVGPDGIGAFYEFKNAQGRSVYIADADVTVAPAAPAPKPVAVAPPVIPKVLPPKLTPPNPATPIPVLSPPTTQAYVETPAATTPAPARESRVSKTGFNLGVVNYAERYKDVRYQAPRALVGLQYQNYFEGSKSFGMDFNLGISPGAPKFLMDVGAQGQSSGYLAMTDIETFATFFSDSFVQFKLAAGVSLIASRFTTTVIAEPYTSESFRAGAVVSGGLTFNSKNWTLLLDARQHIEKESYLSTQVGFLFPID